MHMTNCGLRCLVGAVSLTAVLLLGACDQPSDSAAPNTAAFPAGEKRQPGGSQRFELVLVSRPERLEDYRDAMSRYYRICTVAAQAQKLPVKPLLVLPDNFVTEKTTLLVDGNKRYRKVESFSLDPTGMVPQTGCAATVSQTSATTVVRDGQTQTIDVDASGKTYAEAPQERVTAPSAKRVTGGYSVSQSHNGIALRCLPPNAPAIQGGLALETCVYGGGDAALTDEEGEPELIYARFKQPASFTGVEDIRRLEPLSLVVGKPVRSDVFTFVGATP